jgi:hypothetical protein
MRCKLKVSAILKTSLGIMTGTSLNLNHVSLLQVILTLGLSDTTYHFLKEASKKRDFQVIVAEGERIDRLSLRTLLLLLFELSLFPV